LPGRDNLVLTRGDVAPYAGQRVVHSLVEAIDRARDAGELAVIGGGEVYALALPRATHLDLTWVDTEVAGADAYFPAFDARDWVETSRETRAADARHAFAMTFVDYARR
jgi:dihydrofolate reductase